MSLPTLSSLSTTISLHPFGGFELFVSEVAGAGCPRQRTFYFYYQQLSSSAKLTLTLNFTIVSYSSYSEGRKYSECIQMWICLLKWEKKFMKFNIFPKAKNMFSNIEDT